MGCLCWHFPSIMLLCTRAAFTAVACASWCVVVAWLWAQRGFVHRYVPVGSTAPAFRTTPARASSSCFGMVVANFAVPVLSWSRVMVRSPSSSDDDRRRRRSPSPRARSRKDSDRRRSPSRSRSPRRNRDRDSGRRSRSKSRDRDGRAGRDRDSGRAGAFGGGTDTHL